MKRLEGYVSDTAAGSANQTWFAGGLTAHVGRVYYRLRVGGQRYRLLFSDVMDSTFADGSHSRAGDRCGGFEIVSLRVGLCDRSDVREAVEPDGFQTVTFDGAPFKAVAAGESVLCDPIPLNASAGQTLCVELEVRGERLPCHEELQVASFVKTADGFVPSTHLPVPLTVAVERDAHTLAFLGDSITQGIGATKDSDRHWVARVAERLPSEVAVWNLGIGFARCADAAADGPWIDKVLQNEAAVVCLGVNDLMNGRTAQEIAYDLRTVVRRLKQAGVRVLLQSVPPFEFPKDAAAQWRALHTLLPSVAAEADAFFDVVPYLCGEDGVPHFGGHPNDEGCAVWAEALVPLLEKWLKEA